MSTLLHVNPSVARVGNQGHAVTFQLKMTLIPQTTKKSDTQSEAKLSISRKILLYIDWILHLWREWNEINYIPVGTVLYVL